MGWDRGTGISATSSRTFAPKERHSACGGHPTSRNSEARSAEENIQAKRCSARAESELKKPEAES